DGFAFCDFDKGLDSLLSERHQFVRGEASAESLGSCKADSIHFEAVAVQQVNTGDAQHACDLILMAAFVVMISEYGDYRDVNVLQHTEHDFHLFRVAMIGKVAGDHESIGQVI